MMIALDQIAEEDGIIRRTKASFKEDAALIESIRALGVLQPILVARNGDDRYHIIAGRRRVAAARNIGLTEIPAELREITAADAIAAEAAENMVRAPMAEVDQWRAMVRLQDDGYSLLAAAQALGLSERRARLLDKLGRVHPAILALIEKHGMPDAEALAEIAQAPQKLQAAAAKQIAKGWWPVAYACRIDSIPISVALFDPAASKVVFEEDLFAEPDDPDRFTTTDVAGFIKAQTAHLVKDVNARKKKGEPVTLAEWNAADHVVALPPGWVETYLASNEKKLAKNDARMRFVAVAASGALLGRVREVIAIPAAKKAAMKKAEAKKAREAAKANPTAEDTEEPAARATITKAGLDMIHAAKTEALRHKINAAPQWLSADSLLPLMVALLAANNVHASGSHFDKVELLDLARKALRPGNDIGPIAGEILSRCLFIGGYHDSGEVADWIGYTVGAEENLPRFDTEAFLAHVNGAELRAIADQVGLPNAPNRVSDLRAALVGNAPTWRPKEAAFAAPKLDTPA